MSMKIEHLFAKSIHSSFSKNHFYIFTYSGDEDGDWLSLRLSESEPYADPDRTTIL